MFWHRPFGELNVRTLSLLALLAVILIARPAYAQVDQTWQSSGYDLRELYPKGYNFVEDRPTSQPVIKIGSLSGWRLEFDDTSKMPVLSSQPPLGLREDYREGYISLGHMMPSTLGVVRPVDFPNVFPDLPASSGDWVHREFTYTYGDNKEFHILISRVTPAILLTSNATGLRILGGKKVGLQTPTASWEQIQGGSFIGNPSHFALPIGGSVQVRTADTAGTVDLSGLDQKWFLMWYGADTYLWGTNRVIHPTRGPANADLYNPSKQLYPVDMPVLVVMEHMPQTLFVDPNGGVEIRYAAGTQVGQVAIMPLLGGEYPNATETAAWATGLPDEIIAKCKWWYERLGQYPVSLTETYTVEPSSYDVHIHGTYTYRDLGHGTPFAPVSPVVALAMQEGFPITFERPLVDSETALAIGPLQGIDNATSYAYTVRGLAKYALGRRVVSAGTDESEVLRARLDKELAKVVSAGHLAPWWPLFGKRTVFTEMPIWSMPWETLYYLGETLPLLAPTLSLQLSDYIQDERNAYPPESYQRTVDSLDTVQTMPYEHGSQRVLHHVDTSRLPNSFNEPYSHMDVRPLMALYSLAQYYEQVGDVSEIPSRWPLFQEILRPYIQNSDWSTNTFTPYTSLQTDYGGVLRGGIAETNRLVAGTIGFIRLARWANDSQSEQFGHYIFTKALVSRYAQEKLVKYLYETGQQVVPPNPDWQLSTSLARGETGTATLWRSHWGGYQDDVRRPLFFDQFGVLLANGTLYPQNQQLIAYADLTPELGRFLRDYALAEAEEWYAAIDENSPLWYKAYADTYLGWENPFSIPQNAHEIFLVKAWILGETPERLATYVDIPWVHLGDYYYIHKLAETIKAYRGMTWDDGNIPAPHALP